MLSTPLFSDTLAPDKKIAIGVDVLASIDPAFLEDSFVYVHCKFHIPSPGMLIRIWKTTVLKDCHSAGQSQLIHAENISFAPQWTMLPSEGKYSFLLIFTALPKTCTHFDLIEQIPEPGGFLVKNIQRNKADVYSVNID